MIYQYILTILVLGVCSYTDIRFRKVYKSMTAWYLFLAVAGHMVFTLTGSEIVVSELAAGVVPGIISLFLSFLTRQQIGYGDSVLIIICGISLGLKNCTALVFTAFFWCGVWALILWRFCGKNQKEEIAFVPFLLLGTVIQGMGGIWSV